MKGIIHVSIRPLFLQSDSTIPTTELREGDSGRCGLRHTIYFLGLPVCSWDTED